MTRFLTLITTMNSVYSEMSPRPPVMRSRFTLLLTLAVVALAMVALTACGRSTATDPAMVNLAVRATLYAMPTATVRQVVVTRQVEVTRLVEVTRMIEVTRLVEATVSPTPVATPTAQPVSASNAAVAAVSAPGNAAPAPKSGLCPTTSDKQYATIPVAGGRLDHPDQLHADLNLAMRGFEATEAPLSRISINGPTGNDPPQLPAILGGVRPAFRSAYRVYGWDWDCGVHGCRADLLNEIPVTLLGIDVAGIDSISFPSRSAEIYAGGYRALVLYAEATRITLVYTREDTVATGYTVHLEDLCIDPNLVAAYRKAAAGGRASLPALKNGQSLGSRRGDQLLVAVRDRGRFLDPRSRKDWWK